MRPARSASFAAATDGASAATATTHSAARTAPATLRTTMLPPQETCCLFVIGGAARQGSGASFARFREVVPRVSENFATLCGAGLYLNARLISDLRNEVSTGAHLARRKRPRVR